MCNLDCVHDSVFAFMGLPTDAPGFLRAQRLVSAGFVPRSDGHHVE
ncbi:MAG: hypothetical protein LBF66_02210 [Holosporales bacterium]|nr:hypothetical protein [Holosporales bacterium]